MIVVGFRIKKTAITFHAGKDWGFGLIYSKESIGTRINICFLVFSLNFDTPKSQ